MAVVIFGWLVVDGVVDGRLFVGNLNAGHQRRFLVMVAIEPHLVSLWLVASDGFKHQGTLFCLVVPGLPPGMYRIAARLWRGHWLAGSLCDLACLETLQTWVCPTMPIHGNF